MIGIMNCIYLKKLIIECTNIRLKMRWHLTSSLERELGRRGRGGRSWAWRHPPAGASERERARGRPAGRVPIGEKNKLILVKIFSNMRFLWVYPLS